MASADEDLDLEKLSCAALRNISVALSVRSLFSCSNLAVSRCNDWTASFLPQNSAEPRSGASALHERALIGEATEPIGATYSVLFALAAERPLNPALGLPYSLDPDQLDSF